MFIVGQFLMVCDDVVYFFVGYFIVCFVWVVVEQMYEGIG